MQRSATQGYFLDNLDTIACIAGIVFGIAITSLYLISATIHLLTLGLALTLASLLYLVIKNRRVISTKSIGSSAKILLEVIFFILFSVSLLILHTSDDRPLFYFILIALSVGFLGLSIMFLKNKNDVIAQIIKILMISFSLKYSIFLGYYGGGVDYWIHLAANNNLIQYGFIEILSGKESFYPLMHVQVATTAIITNTPIKAATNFAIIIPLVISSICVFFVARDIINAKTGLFAMLIVNITDFHTIWGATPQTTTYGICLYYFFIFFIFQNAIANSNRKRWLFLTILFIPVLILTHAVSSFVALISILGLTFGSYIYKIIFNKQTVVFPPIITLIIYGIVLLQHWFVAVYGDRSERSFFEVIFSSLITSTEEYADFLNRPETISEYITALPPLFERIADVTGLTLLLLLSAVGCLLWLSKKYRCAFTFPIISCSLLLLFITFGFPLFGMRNVIPSRWFAFMYFFLSIMAMFALLVVLSKVPEKRLQLMMCFLIVFCLAFFMTTSTISNDDSPFWLQETTISTTFTTQEGVGAETLSSIGGKLLVDSKYSVVLYSLPHPAEYISTFSSEQQMSNMPDFVFLWRRYMLDSPIRKHTALEGYHKKVVRPEILGIEFLTQLKDFDKVYDNHGVQGYHLTGTRIA